MKNATINFFDDAHNPNAISIIIKGDLTIDNTNQLKNELLEKISRKSIFNFEISEIDEMDLSFYQFLISIKKTFQKANKQFTFSILLPDDKKELFIKSGFDFNFN